MDKLFEKIRKIFTAKFTIAVFGVATAVLGFINEIFSLLS